MLVDVIKFYSSGGICQDYLSHTLAANQDYFAKLTYYDSN